MLGCAETIAFEIKQVQSLTATRWHKLTQADYRTRNSSSFRSVSAARCWSWHAKCSLGHSGWPYFTYTDLHQQIRKYNYYLILYLYYIYITIYIIKIYKVCVCVISVVTLFMIFMWPDLQTFTSPLRISWLLSRTFCMPSLISLLSSDIFSCTFMSIPDYRTLQCNNV